MAAVTNVLCLLLLTSLLVLATDADPLIQVTPGQIDLGLTEQLEVNCSISMDGNTNMAALISLIVSRFDDSQESFLELASINDFANGKPKLVTTEAVTATGAFNPAGISYIYLQWDYPTGTQTGLYKCSAQGLDTFGHVVVMSDVGRVTVEESDLKDWQNKIRQMDIKMKTLEEELSHCCNHAEKLEQRVAFFESVRERALLHKFLEPLKYKNHEYYISKDKYYDINVANDTCVLYGGYLVEVDDDDEYQAIRAFLGPFTGLELVVISGTDEASEGQWVFPSTNQPVPVQDWAPAQPDEGTSANCLCLWALGSWRMGDLKCHYSSVVSNYYFMCEMIGE